MVEKLSFSRRVWCGRPSWSNVPNALQESDDGIHAAHAEEGDTNRKNHGDPPPHRLRAIQVGLGADEQVLGATGGFPGDDGGAEEKDLDGVAGGQARGDAGVVFGDGHLRRWCDGR